MNTPIHPIATTATLAQIAHVTTGSSKLKRCHTWMTRELHHYLTDAANQPFVWGTHDCCLFAANAIQAMTGVDIADDFRGKYTDQASAFTLIHSVTGGSTVEDAATYCANKHGLLEWTRANGTPLPLMAKRGDLVVASNDAGEVIAGIVDLSGRYVAAVNETGYAQLPLSSIKRAWHVPAH